MQFNEENPAESIPDIIIFVRFNKYNWKIDIEIKILELLKAFLIWKNSFRKNSKHIKSAVRP